MTNNNLHNQPDLPGSASCITAETQLNTCRNTSSSNTHLPHDGRFGSGPSKVRAAQVDAIAASPLGTSHRKPPVKNLVGNIREGLTQLFNLPEGYEVLLGNGGATALWDAIPFALVEHRAQAAVIGEFSRKAAKEVNNAPWLEDTDIRKVDPGQMILNEPHDNIDAYLYAHNETSTGAMSPLRRYGTPVVSGDKTGALTIVDGTSIAGGVVFNPANVDFYYFSPQKCFGSDGGLWIALASPAAIERIERLTQERWVPDFLNLSIALKNSRKNQTYNTPALSTIAMLANQVQWMLDNGGLQGMQKRSEKSSHLVYEWAQERLFARPFITDPHYRSVTVTTIDIDEKISVPDLSQKLRAMGIVDIDPYRSLGRNQLRIATFPAIDPSDIAALLECIDSLIE